MEFFHKQTNFPFMATRKVWYGLSAVLMVICFISFYVRGLNLALDFTGGVSVEVTFSMPMNFLFFTGPTINLTQTKRVYLANYG